MTERFRLRLEEEGRRRTVALPADGEVILGSGSDVDLRLREPTVSRRHARLRLDAGRRVASIEDLQSRNGTWVEGRRIDEPQDLGPGQAFRLGRVRARLETVDEADLESAIRFLDDPGARDEPADTSSVAEPGTLAADAWSGLLAGRLPRLLRDARGLAPGELARAVGAALFESLPCEELEIRRREGEGEEGVLFQARRSSSDGAPHELAEGEHVIACRLPKSVAPSSCVELLQIGLALLPLAADSLPEPDSRAAAEPPRLPQPETQDPVVREIYRRAGRLAASDVSVLIEGASGTGKEVLARWIHDASDRDGGPFVALNCAALPRDLLEAELFGIERGVATGVESRAGRFEQADGGTLFLDEIGDMAAETQAKILRVLEQRVVYRLGGDRARPAAARIVAATNRDVDALVGSGAFRADLLHRIADGRVRLPPLRERSVDIANLAAHFLESAARRRGSRVRGISRAALDCLRRHDWPGNIRELEREMVRAALFVEAGELLQTEHLQDSLRRDESGPVTLRQRLEAEERRAIREALGRAGGRVPDAAAELDVGVSTLYRRIRELGVEPPDPS